MILPGILTLTLLQAASGIMPIVDNWQVVEERAIEIRYGDYGTIAFLGTITEYVNPVNANEHVKVFKRHVSIVSVKRIIAAEINRSVIVSHGKKMEKDELEKTRERSDTIGYIRWQTVKDSWTGQYILNGPAESWLKAQDSSWTYSDREKISEEPVSEPGFRKMKILLVGIKYTLGGKYHVLRVDRIDLSNGEEIVK